MVNHVQSTIAWLTTCAGAPESIRERVSETRSSHVLATDQSGDEGTMMPKKLD